MATRLIGTESTDPWLPDVIKVKADKTRIADTSGNFSSVDVEGALAELAAGSIGGAIGSSSGSSGVPAITEIVTIRLADFTALGSPDASTLYVIVPS